MKEFSFAVQTGNKPKVEFTIELPETEEEFIAKHTKMLDLAQDEYATRASNSARIQYRDGKSIKEIQDYLDNVWQVGGKRTSSLPARVKRMVASLPEDKQAEALAILQKLTES